MPPPSSSLSTRGQQVLDDVDLRRHLRPADDGDERALRVAERLAQVVELLLHQVPGRRLGHVLGDAVGGGVGAVGGAEGVVHVDVGQRGELLGEAGVVAPPRRRGSAGSRAAARRRPAARPPPAWRARRRSRWRTSPRCPAGPTAPWPPGRRLMSGTRLPSGRPRCDIRMTFAPLSFRYLIVGSDSRRRLSLSTTPSFRGTLKSTRTMTRLPRGSRSSMNSFWPVLIPLSSARVLAETPVRVVGNGR